MLQLFANVIVNYYGSHFAPFLFTQSKALWGRTILLVSFITLHLKGRGTFVTWEKAGQ
jgi:hypothetical protein